MMRPRLLAHHGQLVVPVTLVSVIGVSYVLAVVALFASGRLGISSAGPLLGAPLVLALAVLRPEWMILVIVALPPSITTPIPPRQLIMVMVATLFGFVLQGPFRLGLKTGMYPLVGIIALAFLVKPDTTEGAAFADGMLKTLIYYALLILVAFHAAVNGRLRFDAFVDALLVGVAIAAVLQPFVSHIPTFERINYHPLRGHFAYLAAMGFGVSYVRFALNRSAGRRQSARDTLLMIVFLLLTAVSFSRIVWMAVLLTFVLVSMWTGRKAFWVVSSLLLLLALTVPVVGERVVPGGSTDIADPVALARVTTGRSVLWEELWQRGTDALPFGQGWGYVPSLSATELFGHEGFGSGSGFVFPHNDFLYLFVDLGMVGLALLVAYWLTFLGKVRTLLRSTSESARYVARILVPVAIVMLLVQLFDNGLAIRFVAERSFIAIGLMFGLHHSIRYSGLPDGADRFLDARERLIVRVDR